MLCAKKRSGNKTSNYLISAQEGDLSRHSSMFLGKLRANFLGTDFQVFDRGTNPRDIEYDDDTSKMSLRQELGVVIYASNVLGSRGPRKMQVAIPKVDKKSNERAIWRPTAEDEMLTKCKERDLSNLRSFSPCSLPNKKPPLRGGLLFGRCERIRTSDPFVPNEVRYQAAPHTEDLRWATIAKQRITANPAAPHASHCNRPGGAGQ